MSAKRLNFVVATLLIYIAFHAPDNQALGVVEFIIGSVEPHQIACLHHTYSIAQERARVNLLFEILFRRAKGLKLLGFGVWYRQ